MWEIARPLLVQLLYKQAFWCGIAGMSVGNCTLLFSGVTHGLSPMYYIEGVQYI